MKEELVIVIMEFKGDILKLFSKNLDINFMSFFCFVWVILLLIFIMIIEVLEVLCLE